MIIFGFRIPASMKKWLDREAKRRRTSLQNLAQEMLRQGQQRIEGRRKNRARANG